MNAAPRGYREIEHTADWELEVWAPDLATLLEQAAEGMYRLMGVELAVGERIERQLDMVADDPEALLVDFLGELLFFVESQGLAFDRLDLEVADLRMHARLEGATVTSQAKEIKAVTYHRLEVIETDSGWQTRIVFDV